jgi:hypothetical protein
MRLLFIKQFSFATVAALALTFWLTAAMRLSAQEAPADDQGEALTHGPVHEAFAEPTVANPAPSLVVPKEPPTPIEEMPPDVKPDGANVVWVTGYWAWDDARKDFIWISGIWRDTPPGHVWVSGYWSQVKDGYQWTPGFWSPAQQEQVNYLPEPPQTLENGPATPQPNPDTFWVPGNWQYQETRYVWRPGYWTEARPDWIWMPARYVWTPSGYIFIPGHWDYVLDRRGVLFAPVYFATPIYVRRHFVFAPTVVIDSGLLTVNFFVRPNYYHYYFGDCYGQSFVSLGFSPWFSVGVRFGPDPLFAYYSWHHRDDRRWVEGLHEHYTYLNAHPDARPPRTFVQQTTIINNITNNDITINKNPNNKTIAIGAPLNQYVKNASTTNNVKFVNVSNSQRQQIALQGVKEQNFAQERAKVEASTGTAFKGGNGTGTKGIGPTTGGGTAKTLNLQKLAQTSGSQLPGTGGPTIPNGGSSGSGTGPKNGSTVTGPTGGSGSTNKLGANAGALGSSGATNRLGTGALGGSTNTNKLGTGPGTGTGTSTNRSSGTGDNPFRLKSGETLKNGLSGPSNSGPNGSGAGTNGKLFDNLKGFNPSTGRSGGTPPSPTPDRRGTGDSRGKGSNPNDKGNPNDPRNGGRSMILPGGQGASTTAQNVTANYPDTTADTVKKDPIRPLQVSPSLAADAAARAAAARAAANANATGPTANAAPPRFKDPIGPLTISPKLQTPPSNATSGTGSANGPATGPAARSNSEVKPKDPVGPLRIAPM